MQSKCNPLTAYHGGIALRCRFSSAGNRISAPIADRQIAGPVLQPYNSGIADK